MTGNGASDTTGGSGRSSTRMSWPLGACVVLPLVVLADVALRAEWMLAFRGAAPYPMWLMFAVLAMASGAVAVVAVVGRPIMLLAVVPAGVCIAVVALTVLAGALNVHIGAVAGDLLMLTVPWKSAAVILATIASSAGGVIA